MIKQWLAATVFCLLTVQLCYAESDAPQEVSYAEDTADLGNYSTDQKELDQTVEYSKETYPGSLSSDQRDYYTVQKEVDRAQGAEADPGDYYTDSNYQEEEVRLARPNYELDEADQGDYYTDGDYQEEMVRPSRRNYQPVECAEAKYPVTALPPDDECWCLSVRYEPSYYTTQRCIEESVPYKRQCCRYVTKCYEVERCRYVPEYYTETIQRTEPEFYEVEGCRMQKRWVTEQQCEYVPCYYWTNACGEEIAAPDPE